MATLTLTMTGLCAANNHFTLTAGGDVAHTASFSTAEFLAPLTNEEKTAFIRGLVRFAKIGRTDQQVRTALTNGVTVTV
jgi:hypothetical protein